MIFNDYELTSTITQNFPTLIYTYKIRYILDGLSDGVEDESTYKFTVELNEFEGVNHVGCSAEAEIIVPDLPFWGDIPDMFFPNAFSPNNDGVNDLFMPFPATPNEYNVSWYKFQIFGQNGGLFHESEGCAPPGGFNLGDISWDGKNDDGQNLNPGVFVYLLRLDNCNNERPDMPGFPFINGDCNNPTCWYGDVTLLQ